MNSWNLLRYFVFYAETEPNPILQREMARPPIWQALTAWLGRATGTLLMISGLVCYFSVLMVFYLHNLLILLLPFLGIWTLLLILTLAPAVAAERSQRTWDTLRATPLPLSALLLGKAGGAMWWLRNLVRILGGVLIVISFGIGLVSMVLTSGTMGDNPLNLPTSILCISAILWPVISAGLFVADRVQFFVLLVLVALSASASTRTVRNAIGVAAGAIFAAWLADVGLTALLMQLTAGRIALYDLLTVAALGPMAGFLSSLSLDQTVLASAATLAVREIAIQGVWRWTLYAAQAD